LGSSYFFGFVIFFWVRRIFWVRLKINILLNKQSTYINKNRDGVFGYPTMATVACSRKFATVVTERGQLYSWGSHKRLQLGPEPSRIDMNVGKRFVMVAAGYYHAAAIAEDGTVWTWGMGRYGCLGHGHEGNIHAPTQLHKGAFGGAAAIMVVCGWRHTMVLTTDSRVWTFGRGREVQLGHHDKRHEMFPRLVEGLEDMQIVMMAAGRYHSLAATADGLVFVWGSGQLGANPNTDYDEEPWPLGLFRESFGNSNVVFLAAGDGCSAAVTEDGKLFMWGSSEKGQLGMGNTDDILMPQAFDVHAFDGEKVRKVSFGANCTLIVTEKGSLWFCGNGQEGSIWPDSLLDHLFTPTDSLLDHLFTPKRVDPRHFDGAKIITATAGYFISTAVTENGALYTWGRARDPRLHIPTALGHRQDKLLPTRIAPEHMDGNRIGPFSLPPSYALAFAMGMHDRLCMGPAFSLVKLLDDNIVRMVVDMYMCRLGA
jgi:alpha-tubulin suppressor-like RCC1 family protein